ncbi:MAG: ferritin-like domain-containing protein [Nannocystis sp.]|nr:ferritin-like domain-containing protein [Nannocystis sp.]
MPRLRVLILAAVAAGSAGSCSDRDDPSADTSGGEVDGCSFITEAFAIDRDITEADVTETIDEAAARGVYLTRAELTCEHLCDGLFRPGESYWETNPDTCTSTLDPTPGATSEAVVGHVQCAGDAVDGSSGCIGRRPIGHVDVAPAGDDLAEALACAAALEAASVTAFDELASRLARWGAPAELVARCRRAAAEERVHAEEVTVLAQSLGAEVPATRCAARSPDLRAVAIDNAIEGCVREAWGAVVGGWIARSSTVPALREVYRRLFADEVGHAQLAWDLHTWLIGQLDAEARCGVLAAQAAALARLPAQAAAEVRRAPAALGLPSADQAAAVAARFAAALRAA